MLRLINIRIIILAAIVSFIFFSCRDRDNHVVPHVPVNIHVNINNPAYIDLSIVGGWAYVNGGSNGIIVYRRSNQEFVAFDRHCTHKIVDYCAIYVDSSASFMARCRECCGSEYSIIDGSVTKGPAGFSLRQYYTQLTGTMLTIRS